MVVRNSPRTKVDVVSLIEQALLLCAAMLGALLSHYRAATHGEVASTGMALGFQHVAFESSTRQFVSSSQAGNAGTQHQYGLPSPGALRKIERPRPGWRLGHEFQRSQRPVNRRSPARLAYSFKEPSSCPSIRHGISEHSVFSIQNWLPATPSGKRWQAGGGGCKKAGPEMQRKATRCSTSAIAELVMSNLASLGRANAGLNLPVLNTR